MIKRPTYNRKFDRGGWILKCSYHHMKNTKKKILLPRPFIQLRLRFMFATFVSSFGKIGRLLCIHSPFFMHFWCDKMEWHLNICERFSFPFWFALFRLNGFLFLFWCANCSFCCTFFHVFIFITTRNTFNYWITEFSVNFTPPCQRVPSEFCT